MATTSHNNHRLTDHHQHQHHHHQQQQQLHHHQSQPHLEQHHHHLQHHQFQHQQLIGLPSNQHDNLQHNHHIQDNNGSTIVQLARRQVSESLTLEKQDSIDRQDSGNLGSGSSDDLVNYLADYVNLNLVRKMIAQNVIELIVVSVIIIYLVYYFSQISKRPKIIGNQQSKFVNFIKADLKEILSRRFSPLIYFWGTNPQTALFGYLQGQTSDNEVPRNKFKRQFLYVNDAQYLASNVDLSQHYDKARRRSQLKLVQLDANQLSLARDKQPPSLLDQNIRFAIDNIMLNNQDKKPLERQRSLESNQSTSSSGSSTMNHQKNEYCSDISAGSSSDSGVFATGSNSSTSNSSLSGSSLTIDMPPTSPTITSKATPTTHGAHKCNCSSLYDDSHQYLETFPLDDDHEMVAAGTGPELAPGGDNCATSQTRKTREQMEFGQCAIDWYQDSHRNYHKTKLVALISAGMTTGSDKKYVTDTVQTLDKLGYEVCVFIRRGVGGLKLSSTRFFSPSKWRDFESAILSVRKQRPGAKLVAIGFSFGSIELCRYLSMSGHNSLIDAALLISCPFDPEAGGRNMRKRALNRKIDAYLAKNLGKQLYHALLSTATASPASNQQDQEIGNQPVLHQNNNIQYCNLNGSSINLASLPKIKSLVDFEDNYNRVIQNYPNSQAYAADSRLNEHLANIKTPTLCLSSEDDFMAPIKLLPIKQIEANKNLCMILTKRGGHMAFIDGLFWPKKPYFAQRIISKYMLAFKKSSQGVAIIETNQNNGR